MLHPNTIDLTPDGQVLLVSNRGRNGPGGYLTVGKQRGSVLAIDTADGRVLDAIAGGMQCTALDVSDDGSLLVFSDFPGRRAAGVPHSGYPDPSSGQGWPLGPSPTRRPRPELQRAMTALLMLIAGFAYGSADPYKIPPIPAPGKGVGDEKIKMVAAEYRQQKHAMAATKLRSLLRDSTKEERPQILLLFAQSLSGMGFYDVSLRYYREVIQRTPERDASNGSAVLRAADIAAYLDSYEVVADLVVGHPATITPGANGLRWVSVQHYLANGNPTEAAKAMAKTNDDGFFQIPLKYTEGMMLLEQGKLKPAKAALDKAWGVSVNKPEWAADAWLVEQYKGRAGIAIGDLYAQVEGKEGPAIEHYTAVEASTYGWPHAWLSAARLQARTGDSKGAAKTQKMLADKKLLKDTFAPEQHLAAAAIACSANDTAGLDAAIAAYTAEVEPALAILESYSGGWKGLDEDENGKRILLRLHEHHGVARTVHQKRSVEAQRNLLEANLAKYRKLDVQVWEDVDRFLSARSSQLDDQADAAVAQAIPELLGYLKAELAALENQKSSGCK